MRGTARSCDGADMSKNISTVEAIYAAFGRGDAAAILEHLSDDVAWEYQPISHDMPWIQNRRGRAGAGEFLATAAKELKFTRFEVNAIVANEHIVIALCSLEASVVRNGRQMIEVDEPHVWHFDERGRVVKFRHAADTHAQWLAWHGK
jgi:ketosteroid isomerase-like protein